MTKKEIEKLSGEVLSFIKKGERQFVAWIKANEKDITAEIVKAIQNGLPITQAGTLNQRELTKFAATVGPTVRKVLRDMGYESYVTNYVADFGKITKLNARLHQRVNGISPKELERLASNVQRNTANIVLNNLLGDGLDYAFVMPIKNLLLSAGTTGITLTKFVQSLNDAVVGTGEYTKFGNFALTTGRDALGQYDGNLNEKVAQKFDLNALVYVGSIVDDTRAQCERWLSQDFILIEELEGEIQWGFTYGTGMNPATTPETFIIFRGGYSCRHKAVPIRVTKEQILTRRLAA